MIEETRGHVPTALNKEPPPPLLPEVRARFVGRLRQLKRLKELFLDSKNNGKLQLTTLVGDPGVGKTSLALEFSRSVRAAVSEVRVLCGSAGGANDVSFSPIIQVLAARFGISKSELPQDARDKIAAGVAEVMPERMQPEVTHLLAHLMRFPFPSSSVVEPLAQVPGQLEVRTYIAVRRFFEKDSQRATLLLHFDGVERAGSETVNLIHFLAEGLRHCPVFILVTGRPTLFRRHPQWGQGEFPHHRLDLGPLEPEEAVRLFSELMHTSAIPEDLVQIVRDRLEGIPRAVEELTRFLLEVGVITPTEGNWLVSEEVLAEHTIPRTHEEILRARLRALSPGDQQLLRKAAVVGEIFWLDAVLALMRIGTSASAHPDGPTLEEISGATDKTRASLQVALERLRDRGLLVESQQSTISGELEYGFAYPPIWDLAYELTDEEERRDHHRLIAQWLELRPEGRLEEIQEQAGRHFQRAGDGTSAAAKYRRAADVARARFFNDRAIRLYTEALACLGGGDSPTRIHLWHDLGSVYQLKGDFESALDAFERMLRLSWSVSSRTKGAVAFNKLGRLWRQKGNLNLALEYLERGQELFRQVNDLRGLATSLDDIGQVLWLMGRYEEALDRSAKGLEMRRQLGDRRSIAVSLSNIGNIEKDRGLFDEAESCYREAMQLRRAVGDRYGYVVSQNNLGALAFERGDLAQARDSWEDALVEAEQIGALPLQMILLNNIGETAYNMGKLSDARQRIERAMILATEMEDQRALVEILRNLALIELREGNHQKASHYGDKCLEMARKQQMMEMVGKAELALGEIHAETLFDQTGEQERRELVESHFRASIQVFRDLGNGAELAKALRRFGEYLFEGGRSDDARQNMEEAADLFDRLGMRAGPEVRRMLKDLG